MIRLSNISIGIKLSLMSAVGVLLVAAMVGLGMYNNAAVKAANERSDAQQNIVATIAKVQRTFVEMRLIARNIRLASSNEGLTAANKLDGERKKVDALIV